MSAPARPWSGDRSAASARPRARTAAGTAGPGVRRARPATPGRRRPAARPSTSRRAARRPADGRPARSTSAAGRPTLVAAGPGGTSRTVAARHSPCSGRGRTEAPSPRPTHARCATPAHARRGLLTETRDSRRTRHKHLEGGRDDRIGGRGSVVRLPHRGRAARPRQPQVDQVRTGDRGVRRRDGLRHRPGRHPGAARGRRGRPLRLPPGGGRRRDGRGLRRLARPPVRLGRRPRAGHARSPTSSPGCRPPSSTSRRRAAPSSCRRRRTCRSSRSRA